MTHWSTLTPDRPIQADDRPSDPLVGVVGECTKSEFQDIPGSVLVPVKFKETVRVRTRMNTNP